MGYDPQGHKQLDKTEIGDWNAQVGSQETPGVKGKFGLGMRNEEGQRLIQSFAKKMHWS